MLKSSPMSWNFDHCSWFKNTGETLTTADGLPVDVFEFNHKDDDGALSEWAKHFRNHYCLDTDIDLYRGKLSRKDYLLSLKLPTTNHPLGPIVRAGDFGEILVADYLHWIMDFWVPRVRWDCKVVRDESSKGSDVIGFKFFEEGEVSSKDVLAIFEAKTAFSAKPVKPRLQDAINDSAKDHIRIDESLNYIKQRLYQRGERDNALKVERYQSPVDSPYKKTFGAVALFTNTAFDPNLEQNSNATQIPVKKKPLQLGSHPNRDKLQLLVIRGEQMMDLVHDLFRRAADEA